MKKIYTLFAIAIIVCIAAFIVNADSPTLATGEVVFESKLDTSITTVDTVGTTTSQTLTSTRKLKEIRGWNYYLVNNTITGANAANAELIVKILVYNSSGTLLATHVIDTIVAAASQTIALPFHTRVCGDNYSITLTGGAANGAEVITNGFQIVMYRPINWNK